MTAAADEKAAKIAEVKAKNEADAKAKADAEAQAQAETEKEADKNASETHEPEPKSSGDLLNEAWTAINSELDDGVAKDQVLNALTAVQLRLREVSLEHAARKG